MHLRIPPHCRNLPILPWGGTGRPSMPRVGHRKAGNAPGSGMGGARCPRRGAGSPLMPRAGQSEAAGASGGGGHWELINARTMEGSQCLGRGHWEALKAHREAANALVAVKPSVDASAWSGM
jgi:hypothetical protein